MKSNVFMLSAAACLWACGPGFAQPAQPAPKSANIRHHHTSRLEDRLDRMERLIEEQQAEIRALRAQIEPAAPSGGVSPAVAAGAAPAAPNLNPAKIQEPPNDAAVKDTRAQPAMDDESPAVVSMVDRVKVNGAWKRKCSSQAANISLCHPTISTKDGKYSMSLTALVQADAATFDNSEVTGPKGTPIPTRSGFNFRRAQLGVQGRLGDDFEYKFNYDFGGAGGQESGAESIITGITPPTVAVNPSGGRVQSAYVSYRGILDPFVFKIGAFPTPANLADATAADDLLFNERPSPAQLSRSLDADDGRDSLGFQGNGNNWYFSSYLTSDTFGKGQIAGQEAYVGRAALSPVHDSGNNFTVHLGGNIGDVIHPEGVNPAVCTATAPACYLVSFSDRPELREWNVNWIGSGNIDARSAYSAGVEGAVGYRQFLLEGEDFRYGIARRNPAAGQTNPNFSGWYVEGSWVFTGEERVYSMSNAAFLRPVPARDFDPAGGSWGAWELALRYSDTDLDYDANSLVAAEQVRGGDQQIYSAGLNFYPDYNLKFMFDWQNVDIRRPWSGAFDTRYKAFSMRAQVAL